MTVLHDPVIRGFAPAPLLVRAGGWYYLATSSFERFPTIPTRSASGPRRSNPRTATGT
ncbi:hypothetical protein [Streptomyces sp. NPDC048282]|uniref:hypothetical protein n=1 Tax=Streptomyces sp. NPDC048282 TaxID=3365528 RepID=UPI0037151D04